MEDFNNGKVILTSETLSIHRMIGTEKIQRKHITSINYSTGVLRLIGGVINIVTLVGIPRGIKMLNGQIAVTVNLQNGKHSRFFLSPSEYLAFKNIA